MTSSSYELLQPGRRQSFEISSFIQIFPVMERSKKDRFNISQGDQQA